MKICGLPLLLFLGCAFVKPNIFTVNVLDVKMTFKRFPYGANGKNSREEVQSLGSGFPCLQIYPWHKVVGSFHKTQSI